MKAANTSRAPIDVRHPRAYHRGMARKKASARKAVVGGFRQAPDERILSLLMLLLEARRPVAREEIFQRIDAYRTREPAAGERKFERDKKDLRALGVPIEEDEENKNLYYVRQRDYELRPVHLDDEERVALILAAEALRGTEGLVYGELVDDALRKLSFDSGRSHRAFTPANLGITLPARKHSAGLRRTMATLVTAIEGRKRVTITYRGLGGEATVREVDPYAVVYGGGNWQLIGHCHLREKPRTFRVDRIVNVKLAPRPGTPDFQRPVDWNLATYVQRSPWVFQAGDTQAAFDVVLDIGSERGWMADEDFGPGALREPVAADAAGGDGWTRVRFRSGNARYIITRVLDAAGHMKIVEPPGLRARLRRIAASIAGANRTVEVAP
jgi:proteasome accessory factor B